METAAVPAKQLPARLIFPAEAIESAPFRALYDQVRPLGDEVIDTQQAEITFFHPGARGGRLDSLERLLVNAGLPYNLYCDTVEEHETLHYWRPGMKATASTDHEVSEALNHPHFILSVRRACQELVYGQAGLALGSITEDFRVSKAFSHIKVFFRGPDGEQEAGIILMGEFGSGFAYHKEYNGPALDPVNLDYRNESSRRFPLRGNSGKLHGVFEDCLPDGFAHRMLCHDEPDYARMNDVERMFWLGSRTHGSFRFQAMDSVTNESPIRGEKKLEEIRKRVVAFHLNESAFDGEKVMNKYNRFALTYDGGSHPKCLYEHVAVSAGQGGTRHHERTRWVAKFNVDSDVTNRAKIEGTMLDLSSACGINTPEVRIRNLTPSNEDVLMVRRFDEVDTDDGFRPLHKLSMCSITGIDNVGRSRARLGDFSDVLSAVKRISTDPVQDTEELFRRMLFHIAINNADNHFKNFEMLLTDKGWRLAPSFDTLPIDAPPGTAPFSTTVFGEAFPKLSQEFVFQQGRNFGLSRQRSAEIAKHVFEACSKVDHHLDRFGVSPSDRDRVHRAMPLSTIKQLAVSFKRISELEAINSLSIDEPARVVGAP